MATWEFWLQYLQRPLEEKAPRLYGTSKSYCYAVDISEHNSRHSRQNLVQPHLRELHLLYWVYASLLSRRVGTVFSDDSDFLLLPIGTLDLYLKSIDCVAQYVLGEVQRPR